MLTGIIRTIYYNLLCTTLDLAWFSSLPFYAMVSFVSMNLILSPSIFCHLERHREAYLGQSKPVFRLGLVKCDATFVSCLSSLVTRVFSLLLAASALGYLWTCSFGCYSCCWEWWWLSSISISSSYVKKNTIRENTKTQINTYQSRPHVCPTLILFFMVNSTKLYLVKIRKLFDSFLGAFFISCAFGFSFEDKNTALIRCNKQYMHTWI